MSSSLIKILEIGVTPVVIGVRLLLEFVEELVNFAKTAIVPSLDSIAMSATDLMNGHTVLFGLVFHLVETAAHAHARNIPNTLVVPPWIKLVCVWAHQRSR